MLCNSIHRTGDRQRGMATLTTALMVLFLITIIVLYAGKTAVFEQHVAANQFRAAQALAAANGGLDAGLAYTQKGGIDHDGNKNADCNWGNYKTNANCRRTLIQGGQTLIAYFFFCDEATTRPLSAEAVLTTASGAGCGTAGVSGNVRNSVVAVGYSDDGSARRVLVQGISAAKLVNQGPAAPLSSRGSVGLTGNITIINRYTNFSVWTGLGASTWGSGASYLRPKAFTLQTRAYCKTQFPSSNDPEFRCFCKGSTCLDHTQLVNDATNNDYSDLYSDKKYGNNVDVITDDPNMRSPQLSGDDLFEAIFTVTKMNFKKIATDKGQMYSGGSVPSLNGKREEIWIEGNASLNGGNIGTLTRPAALVVNGNLTTAGNMNIIGILYVTGSWDTAGNVTVQGSAISEGTAVAGTGNNRVIYDPVALGNLNNPTNSSLLTGTWRDW